MFHIVPYHKPPILCRDGCNALLHSTRSGIREHESVHSLKPTKDDSSWLHTEHFVYLGVNRALNKRQHTAPLVLEPSIQADEPKMSTDFFVDSLDLAIGLRPVGQSNMSIKTQ
jgi:hypothetical protein